MAATKIETMPSSAVTEPRHELTMRYSLHPFWRLLWAGVWLVFLAYPIGDILSGSYSAAKAAAAWLTLITFAALYLVAMWSALEILPRDSRGTRLMPLVGLTSLGVVLVLVFRGQWSGVLIYCGVAMGWTLATRWLVPSLLALGVFIVLAGRYLGMAWADIAFGAFLSLALGFTMLGLRYLVRVIIELRAAREEIARLAVSEERLRLARDLHDLLGHGLSVIALKAEVARRTLNSDTGTASAALEDVERVARESLREVRDMASGLRQRSLREELDSAREILTAAGIIVEVNGDTGTVPGDVDSLLAWTVREGVTNVIRHSHARRCLISIAASAGAIALEITDDGTGTRHSTESSMGLRGLRERMASAGGRMDAGPRDGGGFQLRVTVPQGA